MSWCVSIKWLTDRQKIDGNHCNFSAILLFSEHVCVLRNMPKITSSNHQPPMMLFFFSLSPLCRKFNVRCCVLLLKPLCVSLLLLCFAQDFCFLCVSDFSAYWWLFRNWAKHGYCALRIIGKNPVSLWMYLINDCFWRWSLNMTLRFVIVSTYNETNCAQARSRDAFTLCPTKA